MKPMDQFRYIPMHVSDCLLSLSTESSLRRIASVLDCYILWSYRSWHIVKYGLDWICKTRTGFVKHGFVKHGFVKSSDHVYCAHQ